MNGEVGEALADLCNNKKPDDYVVGTTRMAISEGVKKGLHTNKVVTSGTKRYT
jgi:hypothetical protein